MNRDTNSVIRSMLPSTIEWLDANWSPKDELLMLVSIKTEIRNFIESSDFDVLFPRQAEEMHKIRRILPYWKRRVEEVEKLDDEKRQLLEENKHWKNRAEKAEKCLQDATDTDDDYPFNSLVERLGVTNKYLRSELEKLRKEQEQWKSDSFSRNIGMFE